ncbi:hypothetical protein [Prosthecobacter sp.]|uniref:hypothetical protein n=1 Tax=Prosthecobacter sp. TaxID=1965333 RepID=UPI002ABBB7CB|nr:hypothetical protein [Prosthecobacter sp.]MDZ4402365.1 hypothetical protein [Prosthecobacter sp.]
MNANLEQMTVKPKQGDETFHSDGKQLGFTLQDFWRWGVSDLVSNATRGRLAEFIVAKALGVQTEAVRDEWGAFDLMTSTGLKIEVKSAAYIQSWAQRDYSTILFSTPKTRVWNPETNETSNEPRRQADVYVFALLAHKDKATLDPLDVHQWRFFILPTRVLDQRTRSQHSITLKSLEPLSSGAISFGELKEAVQKVMLMAEGGAHPGPPPEFSLAQPL